MSDRNAWDCAETVANWPLGNIAPTDYDETRAQVSSVPKDLLSAAPARLQFEGWDGGLEQRRIDIKADGLTIECFGTPSKEKKLFVLLSAAGRKGLTNTKFHRVSWQPWLNGVCLNVEDPTYKAFSGGVTTGWFFGTKEKHALPVVTDIVKKVQARYGIASEDICFIGSSAGGFAALWLADAIAGATAIVGNPQFYTMLWPSARLFATAGIDLASPQFIGRTNLDHLTQSSRSQFYLTINAKSKIDYEQQLPPFLEHLGLPAIQYGLNSYKNIHLYCRSFNGYGTVSAHNSFDDVHEFCLFMDAVKADISVEAKASLLNALHEMQSNRYVLADKLFFLERWAKFLPKVDLPIMIPLENLEAHVARFPLKTCSRRVFYQVTWIYKGKEAEISIRTKQGEDGMASAFKAFSSAGTGEYLSKNGVQILSLGRFPHKAARKAFTKIVTETAPSLYKALGIPMPS